MQEHTPLTTRDIANIAGYVSVTIHLMTIGAQFVSVILDTTKQLAEKDNVEIAAFLAKLPKGVKEEVKPLAEILLNPKKLLPDLPRQSISDARRIISQEIKRQVEKNLSDNSESQKEQINALFEEARNEQEEARNQQRKLHRRRMEGQVPSVEPIVTIHPAERVARIVFVPQQVVMTAFCIGLIGAVQSLSIICNVFLNSMGSLISSARWAITNFHGSASTGKKQNVAYAHLIDQFRTNGESEHQANRDTSTRNNPTF